MRQGERLPAPAVMDVGVHAGPNPADSFTERSEEAVLEGSVSQPLDPLEDFSPDVAIEKDQSTDPGAEN